MSVWCVLPRLTAVGSPQQPFGRQLMGDQVCVASPGYFCFPSRKEEQKGKNSSPCLPSSVDKTEILIQDPWLPFRGPVPFLTFTSRPMLANTYCFI